MAKKKTSTPASVPEEAAAPIDPVAEAAVEVTPEQTGPSGPLTAEASLFSEEAPTEGETLTPEELAAESAADADEGDAAEEGEVPIPAPAPDAPETAPDVPASPADEPAEAPAPAPRATRRGRGREETSTPAEDDAPASEAAGGQRLSPSAVKSRQRREDTMARRAAEQDRAERVSRNQKYFGAISSFQTAMREKRILHGEVGFIQTMSATGAATEGREVLMIGLMVEDAYQVLIPFEEFYRDNPIQMSTVDLTTARGRSDFLRRQRQMAEKLYGADVDFIVTNVIMGDGPEDALVSGSRKQALEIQEMRNFFPSRGGDPIIKEGSICDATIISVGQYTLFANVQGVDTIIPLRDLTHAYTTDLHDKYNVDDTIEVEVTGIFKRPADGHIELTVSAKNAELKDAKRRQRNGAIQEGAITVGTIVSIRPSRRFPDKIVIHAYLPYFHMPAVVRAMDPSALALAPQAGDKMRLRVTGFTKDGFVTTTCHGFHNISKLKNRF